MKRTKVIENLFVALILTCSACTQNVSSVLSPDKSLRMDLLLSNGQLSYALMKGEKVIMDKSSIIWTVNEVASPYHEG